MSNRVARIRQVTSPDQWKYVSTNNNPADVATRTIHVSDLKTSMWLKGPPYNLTDEESSEENLYELQNPDTDKEVRSLVKCLRNSHAAPNLSLGSHRFSEFQNWKNLIETIARLRHVVQSFKGEGPCTGWHSCKLIKSVSSYKEAEKFVIKVVQREAYQEEIYSIQVCTYEQFLEKVRPIRGL